MILKKRKANERLLSILEPGEEPEFVSQQELFRERPYQILRIEHRCENPIPKQADPNSENKVSSISELHYFRNLDEVQEYVANFGHALEDIKWLREIDPP